MPLETLISFSLATVVLAFAPGPDNIFVLTQSALYGKKAGFMITLGLCTGLIVHTSAVALGVATIFMLSAIAFTGLKVIGALYLVYLAWQAFKASSASIEGDRSPSLGAAQLYRRGIIMNLTNPKIAIFFLAFLPQFTNPDAGSLSLQLITLGFIFICISLASFFMIAILAGYISSFLKGSTNAQTVINKIAGLIFLGLALRLVTITR